MNPFASLSRKWNQLMHNEELKRKLYIIIFEADTPAGKAFDVMVMWAILISIILVVVESMQGIPEILKPILLVAEYVFTIFFTIEYVLRIYCSPRPHKYIFSFFGIIDLLATLPLYLSWLYGAARYFMVIRTFRLIRVFRVFKLFNYLKEGNNLLYSLMNSSKKISVFFLFVLILVISIGTLMYMIEGDIPDTRFTNIPNAIYWAIVTLTTVGYGDITPATPLGKFLSAVVMLLGYTIIAVPTGIVSASLINKENRKNNNRIFAENNDNEEETTPSGQYCPHCGKDGHDKDAKFCKYCGNRIMNKELK